MKIIFEGWKGTFVDAYFGDLKQGEWVKVSFLRYLLLYLFGFICRIRTK